MLVLRGSFVKTKRYSVGQVNTLSQQISAFPIFALPTFKLAKVKKLFNIRRTTQSIFYGVGISLCMVPTFSNAEETPIISQEENLSWKIGMKDADIRSFITQVAEATGKSFIVDPRVKARVSVVSNTKMSRDDIYQLFLSVLNVHGFAAVPAGNFIKIVPSSGAKQDTIRFDDGGNKGLGQEIVTRIIQVKNVSALELVPVLRPMIPQYGHLAGIAASNSLILSDHAENIDRLQTMIEKLDVAEEENGETEVIQLQHAWVGDVLELLKDITPIETDANPAKENTPNSLKIKVVADERTNRLILRGDRASRTRIAQLVEKFDQPSQYSGSTQVVRLRHSKAVEMAEILKSLVEKMPTPGTSGKDATVSDISIQADETLNALVIRAQPSVISELRELIDQLDVRRAQVLIEAAVVEVSGDVSNALGVQWASVSKGLDQPAVGQNFSTYGRSLNDVLGALNGAAGVGLADGISIAGGDVNDDGTRGYGVLLQALASASNTNLLSTPSIMTLDNQEAEIVVGQNVPFITGSTATTGEGITNPFQTITREDVGLTLKVIPQINDGDMIRLQVEQEVSSVVPAAAGIDSADLITNKRSIKTTILADKGEIIVLGGLIQDDVTDSESKVPLLGDIPVLGRLFKSTRRSHNKKNLLIFLRPSIVRNSDVAREIWDKQYEKLRSLELGMKDNEFVRWYQEAPIATELQSTKPKLSTQPGMLEKPVVIQPSINSSISSNKSLPDLDTPVRSVESELDRDFEVGSGQRINP
ncbi:MAG: type II secretion system secretin GspD [Pseudomonadota bacterium]